mmetsp:Transcript_22176/g.3683  ORF Transcript_22176/g.3683 Transcript_22176/m.3683 type:complete len:138 (-) Transcript_22176:433-846(-)
METLCKELANYEHLRHIDFSGNKLGNVDIISKIPSIMHLDVHGNMLSKLDIFTNEELFTNLIYLDISRNRFKSLPALKLPKLLELYASSNEIANVDEFSGVPALKVLDLRGNRLKSMNNIKSLPELAELYLADNIIT